VSWPIAALVLVGCLVLGAVIGSVRPRAVRRLLLAVAIVLALVAFVPVRCAGGEADAEVGAEAGQFGGQTFCETVYGARLPEVASLDGDGPGYALSLAGAALVLAGSALVGRRRRRTAVVE
jgi:LPXTG-motif cell wall-anchored protein